MRILTVAHSMPFYGGAEKVIVKLCRYLGEKGHTSTLVAPVIPREVQHDLAGTAFVISGGDNTTSRYFGLWQRAQTLIDSADVVITHNFPCNLAAWPKKKPTVWMCNEPPEVFNDDFNPARSLLLAMGRRIERRHVTAAVVPDLPSAERYIRIYGKTPTIIPYGVDYDFWAPGRRVLDINSFTLAHVGTVTPLKNQMATVKAVGELAKDIPHIVVYLVGWNEVDPGYTKQIEEYIDAHDLRKHVRLVGALDRAELRGLYKSMDLVVHPIKDQGGWLTPFEAMSAGIPVIVGRQATYSGMIARNHLCLVSWEGGDLAAKIKIVYENPKNARILADHAQAWVKDNLTWDNFCSQFEETLHEAVTKFCTGRG